MTLDVGSLLFEERPGIIDPQCTVIFKNDWVIVSSMTLVPDKIPAEEFLAERRRCCIGVVSDINIARSYAKEITAAN